MALVSGTQLLKSYEDKIALSDFSFSLHEKKITGLLGPNGAGKTTLIRLLTGILQPDQGQLRYQGAQISEKHQRKIGYLPEERGLYRKMKVLEQLVFFGTIKGMHSKDAGQKAKDWLEKLRIAETAESKLEQLSKGMQQKVQFIAAILHQPELLILDEPFTGLDPVNLQLIRNAIFELRNAGCTILFSSHRMESVEELCENVILVNKGKKIIEEETNVLLKRYAVSSHVIQFEGTLPSNGESYYVLKQDKDYAYIELKTSSDKAITELNQKVLLKSFTPALAKMEDIFVHLVKEGKQ